MKTEAEINVMVGNMANLLSGPGETSLQESAAFGESLAGLVGVVVLDVRRIADSLEVLARDAKNRDAALTTIGLHAMIEEILTEKGWVQDGEGRWMNPEEGGVIVVGATEGEMGG